MTQDIVAKLRNADPKWRAAQGVWRLIKEAADEIERLRNEGAGTRTSHSDTGETA